MSGSDGADVAGYTRDGVRWELVFVGEKFRLGSSHLRDVIKLLEAHVGILEDDPPHAEPKNGSTAIAATPTTR